ncbi:MAG: hypothetical protein NTV73_16030 [Hyphomicrobiales bacterium]|nr:hypothetical protein [Hyphomicrobiales bacterium]
MSKYTAEEIEQDLGDAPLDEAPDQLQCLNCGRSFSALTALELEHGLCEDCLMKEDD